MRIFRQIAAPATLSVVLAAGSVGLTGCTHEHPDQVPADAMVLTEGTGRLQARAPSDGTVYIYDTSNDKLIYSGKVLKGQLVTMDKDAHRITMDDRLISQKFDAGDKYRIYFDNEGTVERRKTVIEERRIEK